jgi:hypothetical protein
MSAAAFFFGAFFLYPYDSDLRSPQGRTQEDLAGAFWHAYG